MSNYNFESLEGYDGEIVYGPEVVNGTGEVKLRFFEDPEQLEGDRVFFQMPAADVLRLAEELSRVARVAMQAEYEENNPS